MTGVDLCHCISCSNHYNIFDIRHDRYPKHLCKEAKEKYAEHIETLLNTKKTNE
jgi:hypothetical protein